MITLFYELLNRCKLLIYIYIYSGLLWDLGFELPIMLVCYP